QRIHLGLAARVARLPVGLDEASLLEAMERRIQGALPDLQDVLRDGLNALCNRPAVARLGGERFEDQNVEGSLDEIRWPHTKIVYNEYRLSTSGQPRRQWGTFLVLTIDTKPSILLVSTLDTITRRP